MYENISAYAKQENINTVKNWCIGYLEFKRRHTLLCSSHRVQKVDLSDIFSIILASNAGNSKRSTGVDAAVTQT